MKNILIYSNCHGGIIKLMFEKHNLINNEVNVNYFFNYENLHNEKLSPEHLSLLKSCDIFIYQPFNKHFNHTEYDIKHIKNCLNENALIIRINYYRFKGFWYNCNYFTFNYFEGYQFAETNNSGLYNGVVNISNKNNKDDIKSYINNIKIETNELDKFFNIELNNFKKIDDNSDVNMYDYFLSNYKNIKLFHDPYHPTNHFFYEIFKQLVKIIFKKNLISNDLYFIDSLKENEMTHWTSPILPIIRSYLNLNYSCEIYKVFFPGWNPQILYLNIYDYYFIRLCQNNFKKFLEDYNYQVN